MIGSSLVPRFSLKRGLIGAAISALLGVVTLGNVHAMPINVGGVIFDPDNPVTFQMNSGNLRETQVSSVGDTLTGYGLLSAINGTSQAAFCPGCEVTFVFDYIVTAINGNVIEFNMGTSQFYVDNSPDFDVLNPATAADGNLWLDLVGHQISAFGTTAHLVGMLSSGTFGALPLAGFGLGAFDVVGGLAGPNLDTGSLSDGLGGTTDLTFSSSFQSTVNAPALYPIFGSFDMPGAATAVSAAGTLGLMGLSLIGLGFAKRGRKV